MTKPPFWARCASAVIRRLPAGRYRALQHLGRRSAPFIARVPRLAGGFQFVCNLQDTISREVFFTGRYEPQESLILQSFLAPGKTFVDVGANWGYFTLLAAAALGPRGRIVSLEPDPRLYELLYQNLRLNGLDTKSGMQIAAADKETEMTLAGFNDQGGNWGISKLIEPPAASAVLIEPPAASAVPLTEHAPAESSNFQVRCRPLDAVLDELGIGHVDVLKMDIEGAESLALAGMTAGLAAHRYQRILLEVHPAILAEQGLTVHDTLQPLLAHGYRGWWIDHSPVATRRAAYSRTIDIRDYLRPIEVTSALDTWPHILWQAPHLPSW